MARAEPKDLDAIDPIWTHGVGVSYRTDGKDAGFCVEGGAPPKYLIQFYRGGYDPLNVIWDGGTGCVDVMMQ